MKQPVNSSAGISRELDPAICPLCGQSNDCQRCTSLPYKGPCWCERLSFPDELSARIPEAARGRSCVCRACVIATLRARPLPRAVPGDYYLEPGSGQLVFTETYHQKRGYCCNSDCRHCPWKADFRAKVPGVAAGIVFAYGMVLGILVGLGELPVRAETWNEDFSAEPSSRGWQAWGETNRFSWNAAAGRLEVNWDTRGPHSFFSHPLARPLTASDDFSLEFDLELAGASGGVRENRPGAMQVAVGLLNLSRATSQNYGRGAGRAFETVEFNWFPEGFLPGFGTVEPTLSAIAFDDTGRVAADFLFPLEISLGIPHRITLKHQSAPRVLSVKVARDGFDSTVTLSLPSGFGDFGLDAVAIMVWDERTSFSDSLDASGSVDNLVLVQPDPPIGALQISADGRTVEFASLTGWRYTLEATSDFKGWAPVGDALSGTGKKMQLMDVRKAAFPQQFYQVRAEPE